MQAFPLILALISPPPPWLPPPPDTTASTAHVAEAPATRHADPLFGDGASFSLATGVPFLGMGEAAWGFGDRFTLGVLLGATPNVLGVGARPRAVIIQGASDRLQVVVPMLYYPQTSDGSPWVLARPMLELSHATESGIRFGFGVGIIAATAVGADAGSRPYSGSSTGAAGIAWWTTFGAHFAIPLGEDWSLFTEATLVTKGLRLAGTDWVGGPPFTVSAGISVHL